MSRAPTTIWQPALTTPLPIPPFARELEQEKEELSRITTVIKVETSENRQNPPLQQICPALDPKHAAAITPVTTRSG